MQKYKISIAEACCVILFFLYGLGKIYIFSISEAYSIFRDIVELCIYGVMVYAIVEKRLRTKELLITLLIGVFLLYEYLSVGYAVWFRGFLMIIVLKNIKFKRVCKYLFYASLIPMLLGIVLYVTGISDSGIVRREAVAWGLNSPNTFAMSMFVVWMLWLCTKSALALKDYIFTWIFAMLGYLMHGSRSFLFVMILLPFVDMVIKKLISLKRNKIFKGVVCLSQAFFMVLSVILVKMYPVSVLVQSLNPLFGGRVFLNYYNYSKYGVGLLGKSVTLYNITDQVYNDVFGVYSNVNYSTVDNVYIATLITMGILQVSLFLVGYYMLVKKAWENKNTLVIAIAIIFSAYGFTESAIQEIYINFVYLYILSFDTFSENSEIRRFFKGRRFLFVSEGKKMNGIN